MKRKSTIPGRIEHLTVTELTGVHGGRPKDYDDMLGKKAEEQAKDPPSSGGPGSIPKSTDDHHMGNR